MCREDEDDVCGVILICGTKMYSREWIVGHQVWKIGRASCRERV